MFCKGQLPDKGNLPADIPANPYGTYQEHGWISWGDWLGNGNVGPKDHKWRAFEQAREFARSLKLQNRSEWKLFCRSGLLEKGTLPDDISIQPDQVYKHKGWKSWGDWLGTGSVWPGYRQFRPFEDARAFARSTTLKTQTEWRQFCRDNRSDTGKLPSDIPSNPDHIYKSTGWISWGDWLGTGSIAPKDRKFRSFKEARQFARSLHLTNYAEWRQFCKGELAESGILPENIPSNPNLTYANEGWKGYGDWLGTGRLANHEREFRPFKDARRFVRSLGLAGKEDWSKYCRGEHSEKGPIPADIPATPERVYREQGWAGYGDWLGTGRIANHLREYRDFQEARAFVRSLGLRSEKDWRRFCGGKLPQLGTRPSDIPANPPGVYKGRGWKGWGDWLGTGNIWVGHRKYLSFEEARQFVHAVKLKSQTEWRQYCLGKMPEKGDLPEDIPSWPDSAYRGKGWGGWSDWLGTEGGVRERL